MKGSYDAVREKRLLSIAPGDFPVGLLVGRGERIRTSDSKLLHGGALVVACCSLGGPGNTALRADEVLRSEVK